MILSFGQDFVRFQKEGSDLAVWTAHLKIYFYELEVAEQESACSLGVLSKDLRLFGSLI